MSNIATFAMKFIHFYLYNSLEKIKMHAKYKAEWEEKFMSTIMIWNLWDSLLIF